MTIPTGTNKSNRIGTRYTHDAEGRPVSYPVNHVAHTFYAFGFTSSNNPFRDGHFRGGGPFTTCKGEIIHSYGNGFVAIDGYDNGASYEGSFYVNPSFEYQMLDLVYNNANYWGTQGYTDNQRSSLAERGAEAWAKLRPDLPDFSLASSVAELKDFPGMYRDALRVLIDRMNGYKGRRGSALSHTGQWYLAIQFGWLPLLGDIRNFVRAQQGAQKRLAQLIRDAGKPVRRKTTLRTNLEDNKTVTQTSYHSPWSPCLEPQFVTYAYADGPGYCVRTGTETQKSRCWAEAQMRYFLPPGPQTVKWKKSIVRKIMGAMVTPREVYQLMPWSWLADYFTGLGDFINATSGGVADNLICDYAYLMETRQWDTTTEAENYYYGSVDRKKVNRVTASVTYRRTSKIRMPASPFGWGLKQSDLSPKQVAILGALGLSRLP